MEGRNKNTVATKQSCKDKMTKQQTEIKTEISKRQKNNWGSILEKVGNWMTLNIIK